MLFTLLKANAETSVSAILPFIVFEIVFIILIFLKDHSYSRKIQSILLFAISGFVIAINSLLYQVGYLLFIFVFFLTRKHKVFNKKPLVFYIIIIIFLCFAISISAVSNSFEDINPSADVTVWHVLNQLLFLMTTLLLIYFVFEDDIKKLTAENKQLGTQIQKSRIYVNLGSNISSLVHNMKNDIQFLLMSLEIVKQNKDSGVDYIESGIERLNSKIKNIMTIAKYSQIDEKIELNINDILDSVVEIFSINKDYKSIRVEKDFKDQLIFRANASEISQVFENIIKNAYEALELKDDGKIDIKSFLSDNNVIITIKDNGPGISKCIENDCKKNCQDCDVFREGRTTKKEGTGFGMVSVLKTLNKYNGKIQINTSKKGTEIKITLPQ